MDVFAFLFIFPFPLLLLLQDYFNHSCNQPTLHHPKIPRALELSFPFPVSSFIFALKTALYVYPNLLLFYKTLREVGVIFPEALS